MRGGKGPGDPEAGAPGPSPGGTPLGLRKASKDPLPMRLQVLVRGLLAHERPPARLPKTPHPGLSSQLLSPTAHQQGLLVRG